MNEYEQNFNQQVFSSQMKLQEENQRLAMRENHQISVYQKKLLLKEEERERRKSQIDLVEMSTDGVLTVRTQNLQMDARTRMVCNFFHPEIIIYKRCKRPEEVIYQLHFELAKTIKYIWLIKENVGNPSYIMKKLIAMGGQIMGENVAKRKEYVLQIVSLAIVNAHTEIFLPDERGWYIDENKKLKFYCAKYTWKEIINYV